MRQRSSCIRQKSGLTPVGYLSNPPTITLNIWAPLPRITLTTAQTSTHSAIADIFGTSESLLLSPRCYLRATNRRQVHREAVQKPLSCTAPFRPLYLFALAGHHYWTSSTDPKNSDVQYAKSLWPFRSLDFTPVCQFQLFDMKIDLIKL